MRIAFVHPSRPGSQGTGATHTATQIVEGLADRGHDLRVYCSRPDGESETGAGASYECRVLDGERVPHTNTRLNRALRSVADELDTFDVVHSYLPATIGATGYIGATTGAATVVTLNAYKGVCAKNDLLYLDQERCQDNSWSRCVRCLLQTSPGHDEYSTPYRAVSRLGDLRLVRRGAKRTAEIDAFRAPSAHVKSNHVTLGYPAETIQVVPHPVDERFDIEHTSAFSEPYRLLYVGSLDRHKGVETLVPLVAELAGSDVAFSLTVVGSGGQESTMREQAAEHGVTDHVDFRGFVPYEELPDIYAAHDCFVYPGIWDEPLARVYLEALATGTPIVTSEYGSIAEIVGEAGRLTDGSVAGFRDTLLETVASDALPEMSAAAAEQVEQFRLGHVLDQIETMYADAIG